VFRATEPIQTQAEKIQQRVPLIQEVMTITTATAVYMKMTAIVLHTAEIMNYTVLTAVATVLVMRAVAVHTAVETIHLMTTVITVLPTAETIRIPIQVDITMVTEVPIQVVTAIITEVPIQAVTAITTEVLIQAVTAITTEIPVQVVTAITTEVPIQAVTAIITEVPIQAVIPMLTAVLIQTVMMIIRITAEVIHLTADNIPIYITAVAMMDTAVMADMMADIRSITVATAVKREGLHLQEVRGQQVA
jgi:hypothetical protein